MGNALGKIAGGVAGGKAGKGILSTMKTGMKTALKPRWNMDPEERAANPSLLTIAGRGISGNQPLLQEGEQSPFGPGVLSKRRRLVLPTFIPEDVESRDLY